MANSAYIHIPFCKSKCKYCSFISFPKLELKKDYLDALKKEIQNNYKGELLNTLYFGGGTPSLLTIEEFRELINLFNIDKNTEVTAELNPETLTQEYFNGLKKAGVNRISLGCQTFDDEILQLIGRRHDSKQVEDAVEMAKNAGFENISLDFIYGLPNQIIEGFEKDLRHAKELGVQHITLYGLKIDEGCYFASHYPENLPDDDTQADMYLKAVEVLQDFEHYEVSNFGKPSRHNLNYWNCENYYGFGVAAHGYLGDTRYSNVETIEEYMKNPLKRATEKKLKKQEKLEEEIFLGFRKMNGINVQLINQKYDIDFEQKYSDILTKYSQFFVKTDNGYAFNIRGVMVSNVILSEFLQ